MNVILAPILIPLVFAALAMFTAKSLKVQRIVAGLGSLLTLIASIIVFQKVYSGEVVMLRVGGWELTYGIVFVADITAALLCMVSCVTHLLTFWYLSSGGMTDREERLVIHPIFLVLGAGVNWAFFTGDLFNLFVSFEIILLCSYALIVHGGQKGQLREGFKFVILNLIASAMFLTAAGLTYSYFGSLNFADLAIRIQQTENKAAVLVIGSMLLFVFAMKSAVFPLYYWLPDAYPKAPVGILPYFGGILTKVGVYCLFRVFTLIFSVGWAEWFQPILLAIGALTMFLGVMGAVGQWTIRRILSVHIISQIGYMIFALGLNTPLALGAGLFYIIHNMVVKSALFMVGGAVVHQEGSDGLKEVKGLMFQSPALALLFLMAAFSLAGIPPLSGFYGKYTLAFEGIREGYGFYVGVSILTGLFTMFSMTKIWSYVFWGVKDRDSKEENSPEDKLSITGNSLVPATAGLVFVTLILGLGSGYFFEVSKSAGRELNAPQRYIYSVLGQPGVDAFVEAKEEKQDEEVVLRFVDHDKP